MHMPSAKNTIPIVPSINAAKVYVAKDADERVTDNLLELCREKGVEVIGVESMNELGKACGIHVKAAAAAVLKD